MAAGLASHTNTVKVLNIQPKVKQLGFKTQLQL